MMKKRETEYYTPDISELFIGYELQVRNTYYTDLTKGWGETKPLDTNLIRFILQAFIPEHLVHLRTKYLDNVDIESLGWKYEKTNYIRNWYTGSEDWFNNTIPDSPSGRYWGFELCHDPEMHTVAIKCRDNGSDWEYFYQGECKSINELRKIMSWLNLRIQKL